MKHKLPLDIPLSSSSIIKVIGVGGGGGNAVNHMYRKQIKDVTFIVCNTDNQALNSSPVPIKVQLGENTTAGLGAGGKPEVAKNAAEESIERIKDVLAENTRMVFVTAGMGGGTGTGASPVVAKVSKDMGYLTVGIVTIPFAFEGKQKFNQAIEGVHALSEHVDALLVINNEKLRELFADLDLSNAFAKADDVLSNAARGIAEIITENGHINTDFADVHTILSNGKVAIMNTGYASGANRITNAIKDALNSPLLNTNDVKGASKILLNLYCSREHQIRMEEISEVHNFMADIGENIMVIWGAAFDDSLEDKVKITIIATGYQISDISDITRTTTKKEASVPPVGDKLPDNNAGTTSNEDDEEIESIEDDSFNFNPDVVYSPPKPITHDVVYSPPKPITRSDNTSTENKTLKEIETTLVEITNVPAWKRKLNIK